MRTGWMLLLLLSLGLNIGLGYRVLKSAAGPDPAPAARISDRAPGADGGDEPRPRRGWGRGGQVGESSGWGDPESMADRRARRLGRSLGLDDRQRERLRRAQAEVLPDLRSRRRTVARIRGELHRLLLADNLDSELIWEKSRLLSRSQAGLDSLVLATLLAEVEAMDPAQREAYFDRLPRWAAPAGQGDRSSAPSAGRGDE